MITCIRKLFHPALSRLGLLWITLTLLSPLSLGAKPGFDPNTPILLRPFGDSITYGVGFFGSSGFCPTYNPAKLQYPFPGAPGQFDWTWSYVSEMQRLLQNMRTQERQKNAVRVWCPIPNAYGGGYRGWLTFNSLDQGTRLFRTEGNQHGGSNYFQWRMAMSAHDGYPGFRSDQLLDISKAISFADATLVHVGTNDMLQGKSVDSTYSNLKTIVANLLNKNARTHVFVAQIIQTTNAADKIYKVNSAEINKNIAALNTRIEQNLIPDLTTPDKAKRVTVVNMSAILDSNTDYWDGIHPNGTGYWKMACVWQSAIYSDQQPCPVGTNAQIFQEMKRIMEEHGFPGPPPEFGPMTPEDFLRIMQSQSPQIPNPGRVRERVRQR